MKVGHFGKFFSKVVRLENIFGNRVRKKKFQRMMVKSEKIFSVVWYKRK